MLRRSFLAAAVGTAFSGCRRTSAPPPEPEPTISFQRQPGRIEVLAGSRPVAGFIYDPKYDKPFVYPLRTVSGTILSRGYPVDPRPGESDDHPWHRGIWWGHGDINGHDFWREQGRDKTGILKLKAEPTFESHGPHGVVRAALDLQPAQGDPIGTVELQFGFMQAGRRYEIDAMVHLLADRGTPLRFGDTEDGGFGIRLRDEFRQDQGAKLTNSEGLQGTENIWGKPAGWVDYSAMVDGEMAGVTMIDDPGNLRHPTRWHARGYGLCSANPFALSEFTGDPRADASYTIRAGEELRLRYRVVMHEDGEPAAD